MSKKHKRRSGEAKRKKAKLKSKNLVARDFIILAAYRRECDLREKKIQKPKYTRKKKHILPKSRVGKIGDADDN